MSQLETTDDGGVYCAAGVEILGAIDLLSDGWVRRTVSDPSRIDEMVDLYRDLGFETTTTVLDPATFGEACTSCAVDACATYVALYTRKRDNAAEATQRYWPPSTRMI